MKTELTIVADDFTGALDTGVKLALQGFETLMLPHWSHSRSVAPVMVHETASRHCPASMAKRRIAELAPFAGCVYKKTDSTLRGNVGAELEALTELGEDIAFVPAYPAQGRTTKSGVQLIDGTPIGESRFGSDPMDPVRYSSVLHIIAAQSSVRVVSVGCDDPLPKHQSHKPTVYVFDASTDRDLMSIADRIHAYGRFTFFAGCAGFAAHLPRACGIAGRESAEATMKSDSPRLLVSGSVHPRSIEQASCAVASGWADVVIPADLLFGGSDNLNAAVNENIRRLDRGESVVLRSVRSPDDLPDNDTYAAAHGFEGRRIGEKIADVLGELAARCFRGSQLDAVMVFGGDTASALCRHLQVEEIQPFREPFSGVIASRIHTAGRPVTLWTKAGGFGAASVVSDVGRLQPGGTQ